MNELQRFDCEILQKNSCALIGIDEAGRGPLAGPVVACAVCAPKEIYHLFEDVNDSKKLTDVKREKIYARINGYKIAYGVGFASAKEIDEINILQATFLAMRRACQKFLDINEALALVDGNHKIKDFLLPQQTVIDGDAKSFSIAMASVIAKVHRDRYMRKAHELYPVYGFDGHKGYGSGKHIAAIKEHGPCKEHRMTFAPLKNLNQLEFL
ncbi:Ribonuclease H [Elusimicrobium minutum Pei191]|uniref:Ribonuclease HII n=1 Tax=Elusimicrobium minutum (strain Pei191) TaxID=445932 RepID=B2KC56_ELUMP|nr:ribonuclease HII [Elusimicrobium minutum]ACC98183.1 Ribonuclease H [Elusimicrobium minutum Pei191]